MSMEEPRLEALDFLQERTEAAMFADVLELAAETCLTDIDRLNVIRDEIAQQKDNSVENPMAHLINQQGLWGLRTAIEQKLNPFFYWKEDSERHAEEYSPYQLLEAPTTMPNRPNTAIQTDIEAFGSLLLQEAFNCLGDDAEEKVSEYRNAQSLDEETAVINWLIKRVMTIAGRPPVEEEPTETAETDEVVMDELSDLPEIQLIPLEEDFDLTIVGEPVVIQMPQEEMEELQQGHFYHPVRLSPKLLGKYPETKLEPTCLGISILITAFFEKAGVPSLHAGVARTSTDNHRTTQLFISEQLFRAADKHKVTLPDFVKDKLLAIDESYKKSYKMDQGVHAAVLARGLNCWYLIDPNFSTNTLLGEVDSKAIDDAYEIFEETESVAPGIEAMISTAAGNISDRWMDHMITLVEDIPSMEEVEIWLRHAMHSDDPLGVLYMYLRSKIFDSFSETGPIAYSAHEYYSIGLRADPNYYAGKIIDRVLKTYCFSDARDDDISASVERCYTDESYRQRRMEDLRLVPMYSALAFATDYLSASIGHMLGDPHAVLEIGLPQYRIGACVLSDFASYCDDRLSADFWMKHWPSHIALLDHQPQADDKKGVELMKKMKGLLIPTTLRYYGAYGIVEKFLEQGEDNIGS